MADKGNDPAVIWQTMIGELEKGFNSFANRAMETPEFSRLMNQAGGVAAAQPTDLDPVQIVERGGNRRW